MKKIVSKNDEVEHDLRKSVKEAEFDRRKKEQEVKQLQEELSRKRREDAARIREEIARAEREERELEQSLIKEKSKLDQVRDYSACTRRNLLFSSCTPDGRIITCVSSSNENKSGKTKLSCKHMLKNTNGSCVFTLDPNRSKPSTPSEKHDRLLSRSPVFAHEDMTVPLFCTNRLFMYHFSERERYSFDASK